MTLMEKLPMNRRQFIGTSLGALAAAGLHPGRNAFGESAARPNILFIMTDQQFAGALGCAGNADVKTPAMDSLAANGVRFEKAYCANPLCVPSRTVMLTGKMPHETGITRNIDAKSETFRTPLLGRFFTDAGYDCGYAGKWHLPLELSQTDIHGFGWFPKGGEKCPDAKIPEAAAEFFDQKRDKPFLFVASFINPHDICQWARGDALPHGPIPDPPPPDQCPALPDNFAIPEHEPDVIRKVQHSSKSVYPTVDWTPDRWRQYRWAYYRLVEKVDALIGELLDALRASGQEDNTLIVFTADHGDGTAAHHWNQKQVLYEETTRVPFILGGKAFAKAGTVDREHLVSTGLDLIPTLCDYAGVAVPEGLRGRSVRPLAEGKAPDKWREDLVVETQFEYEGHATGIRGRMLRTQRHKYIVYSEGTLREQLFDLETDPGEMTNLAVNPDNKALLEDCRIKLQQWGAKTGDVFELPTDRVGIHAEKVIQ
jgi:arylsulfatase A-like enzyme